MATPLKDHSIFICYRRGDFPDLVGRIYDHLTQAFGDNAVFRDIESIASGRDFSQTIDQALEAAKVGVVMIGPQWLALFHSHALEHADFVGMECYEMLQKPNFRTITCCLNDAKMPAPNELPEQLQKLTYIQACQVRGDRSFKTDIAELIRVIKGSLAELEPKPEPPPVPMTSVPPPVTVPAPVPPPPPSTYVPAPAYASAPAKKGGSPLLAIEIVAALALIGGVVVLLAVLGSNSTPSPSSTAKTETVSPPAENESTAPSSTTAPDTVAATVSATPAPKESEPEPAIIGTVGAVESKTPDNKKEPEPFKFWGPDKSKDTEKR